ncbi:uncharacterized protein LOC144063183 isoform X2 [Vanacampus margaritifer]
MESLREEFEPIIGTLEWRDVAETLEELCVNILHDPTSLTPPQEASMLRFDVHPQLSLCRMPFQFHTIEAEAVRQEVFSFISRFASSEVLWRPQGENSKENRCCHFGLIHLFCPVPWLQFTNLPVSPLPEGATLHTVITLNVVNDIAALPLDAPSPYISKAKKRRHRGQQDVDQPHIKKTPNAFMCFLKEKRAKVKAQMNLKDSAAVNTYLGQIWLSLGQEEQAKYFEMALAEKKIHSQLHPDWSNEIKNTPALPLKVQQCIM